ncbi:phosphate ABC transporter permease PstA [Clostridium saccharoperbutylacetonicum]|jgi:phosphate transport system permease protein|uniref:Phosphate transport system permease protein PstA n=2 Tax=Bacillota TaxID=1239 RepID=M1LQ74_9CLOT|nr:phosphate ABC transporter permease PstA [Clostridium saccharoperbutylacetonicum]AGF55040.1 phosphate ABC transporter permease protein 2 [Clostridium saccharoperbutylacetonicum N1-4(HMT)]AQR93929.1 phosphate transport system permease protein PstA [Clostridium saccharoperbutylacetonicum]NRT64251.1 phosphate transport system permease protein [Clostridium saccharoperbutylacetonicum]NSB27619.1 phosphate transport system permease protein [Clostridium saccharoperbutylacetonicum]NSB29627.1 phosphat
MDAKRVDKIATVVFYVISTFIVVLLGAFILYILYRGGSMLKPSFLFGNPKTTGTGGGIGPELFNSFYMLIISLVITIPIGVGAGIYLAEYAKEGPILRFIRMSLETISSLPSIVIGMFGLLVFVTMAGWGYSILAGALSVSILNIPSMTRISENAISAASKKVKEASIGLGATKWQTLAKITVPTAMGEILTGIILASGRIFGEAAAFLYTAGLSSKSLNFDSISLSGNSSAFSLFRPAETLAVHIWKLNSEGIVPDAAQIANGTAAVLIIAVLIFNVGARLLGNRLMKAYSGK